METTTKTRYKGLCGVCKLSSDCTFPRPHRAVAECLEFEGMEGNGNGHRKKAVHESLGVTAGATADRTIPGRAARVPDHAVLGLCRTCDRLTTCSFAKPASGVWFCEEYA